MQPTITVVPTMPTFTQIHGGDTGVILKKSKRHKKILCIIPPHECRDFTIDVNNYYIEPLK